MDKLIDIVIPVIKKHIKVPQGASRLIYQLNYRGLETSKIIWGDPLKITLSNYTQFRKYIEIWRNSKHKGVRKLYEYLSKELKYELKIIEYNSKSTELFEIVMVVPQNKIEEFTQIFYGAHQHEDKQFLTLTK